MVHIFIASVQLAKCKPQTHFHTPHIKFSFHYTAPTTQNESYIDVYLYYIVPVEVQSVRIMLFH